MIREHKPHPTFKIESIEEWMARTKRKPKKVDFSTAYKPIQEFVRNVKKKKVVNEQ